jgi:hypothetical protein
MAFSGALVSDWSAFYGPYGSGHSLHFQTITDLDDFLTPSQACIIPVRQTNKVAGQEDGVNGDVSAIHVDLA